MGKGKSGINKLDLPLKRLRHVLQLEYMERRPRKTSMLTMSTRNVFVAALKDVKVWVMNVVPITSSDTLLIIYERGLFGMYHDWCESFSTYLNRCKLESVIAEIDRILRPKGILIVRDDTETITVIENMSKSLQWKIQFTSEFPCKCPIYPRPIGRDGPISQNGSKGFKLNCLKILHDVYCNCLKF
ncbi:hypothetical protein POM88_041191 [Heracleum sosnowskyi]|uniref:Methyltransferase n=1 Tax=Heracleum sosnowskyi TaxID=360622 RepID=A0AAD8HDQ8_9APIA|nr:hypothetical protein POM88_041191 [Heracleum sosnowskyi]